MIDGRFQEMKNRGWHGFSDRAPAEAREFIGNAATFFLAQPVHGASMNVCSEPRDIYKRFQEIFGSTGRCKSALTTKQTAEDFHIPQQGISQHRLHCLESTSFVARSKLF
ncbi:TPA: hypothetical protein DHW51_07895 [Candidatus Poribacteria bacterium]|nr:hypothetical protein [Candidatus Poribacteria bacterium]HCK14029.1 hypothetical protein [Candidatus Poribacteria bacterium]